MSIHSANPISSIYEVCELPRAACSSTLAARAGLIDLGAVIHDFIPGIEDDYSIVANKTFSNQRVGGDMKEFRDSSIAAPLKRSTAGRAGKKLSPIYPGEHLADILN